MRLAPGNILKGRRPSAATLVAVLALVVATGGTSYAAVKITGRDIQNNSITGADLRDGSVTSKDVKNRSLKANDFAKRQLPAGPQGPAGPPGTQGAAGAGRWVLINTAGQIEAQSGGFSVTAGYPVLPNTAVPPAPDNSLRANGNVYINANEPLTNNGVYAVVALQNTVDLNADGITNGRNPNPDSNPEFSGEIAVSQCGLPGTACAPPGTGNINHLVVSPRQSDGTVTSNATGRKRFYVIITGDSTDFVAPAS
jgi:hypothetical protein